MTTNACYAGATTFEAHQQLPLCADIDWEAEVEQMRAEQQQAQQDHKGL